MHNIRKSRLALTLFLLVLTGWLVATKGWKQILDLPRTLRSEIYSAQYDAYAHRLGKTTGQLAREFYQQQVAANESARAAGKVQCSWWSAPPDCYLPPVHGLPAIGEDPSGDDTREGIRRTALKSLPLLLPFVGSLFVALFVIYALPEIVRGFWAWLAPDSDQ